MNSIPLLFLSIGLLLNGLMFESCDTVGVGLGLAIAGLLAGVAGEPPPDKRVKAGIHRDSTGKAKAFTLELRGEKIILDPGKKWGQVDGYKWVTRGLVETPQSFHVMADGTVDINDEKIQLADPNGIAKLEHEINKRHAAASARKPAAVAAGPGIAPPPERNKVHYRVKLDHLHHLMVECVRGEEKVETSMKGLHTLVHSGLLVKPGSIHVDPLQRAVEIDGVRYECSEAGARQLEEALNSRYVPILKAEHEGAIELRENPASATGFDIHFVTIRAGVRFEVKGHLSQENLDILQDPVKSDLLRSGIILRLSAPYLLVRRRRQDGGEEKIPELPDVMYRRVSAVQLEQLFNHPAIRRGGSAQAHTGAADARPPAILEMRIARGTLDKEHLWIECLTSKGRAAETRAFTHHNVADLQHAHVFLPHLDVSLSLDGRKLSILDTKTQQEEHITVDVHSTDEDLGKASRMLTAVLKPPEPGPVPSAPVGESLPTAAQPPPIAPPPQVAVPPPVQEEQPPPPAPKPDKPKEPEPPAAVATTAVHAPDVTTKPAVAAPPDTAANPPAIPAEEPQTGPEAAMLALFSESNAARVNSAVFNSLGPRFGMSPEHVRLSLPRVFENRLFEVLNFSQTSIESILNLRGEDFYGFYLSHVGSEKLVLDYACGGLHIEWGPGRCLLQLSHSSEPSEFKGTALLGLALDQDNHFVFIVQPACKDWVKPHEKLCDGACASFATPAEVAAAPDKYDLVWPTP